MPAYRHDDDQVSAWYPQAEVIDESLLVWVAPADGAWAVYHGSVYGVEGAEESVGHPTRDAASAVAEDWLVAAGWQLNEQWPAPGF